jgi:hypothetical protein
MLLTKDNLHPPPLHRVNEKVSGFIPTIFFARNERVPIQRELHIFFNYLCSNLIESFGVKVETVDRVTPLTEELLPAAFGLLFREKRI